MDIKKYSFYELEIVPGFKFPGLLDLIEKNGNKRITQKAFDWYRDPDSNGILVCCFRNMPKDTDSKLVGISAAKYTKTGEVDHCITVVQIDYRNQEIGSTILKVKNELLKKKGIKYETTVASDNNSSLRICEKSGLFKQKEITKTRKSGDYTAVVFGVDKPVDPVKAALEQEVTNIEKAKITLPPATPRLDKLQIKNITLLDKFLNWIFQPTVRVIN
jgi:hypothetical protein